MIDWERKARDLAIMIEQKRPIKEIRQMARGVIELMELEQQEREAFWAFIRCRGTKDERDDAELAYILAIRRSEHASRDLDRIGD